MKIFATSAVLLTAVSATFVVHAVRGDDWPQWRGPRQDGVSRETGLMAQWPENGPLLLWRVPLGGGFSAISVVGDRVYTLFGGAEGEFAAALSAVNGKTIWKTRLGDLLKSDSYGDGPRATPAVDSGRLYALSGAGALRCLDTADGHVVWGCDLLEKFGGQPPEYGFAASPLVLGDMLLVVTGAGKGKSLAAFDKTDGKLLWTSLNDKIGYSTPHKVSVDGVDQIIVLMGEALVSVCAQRRQGILAISVENGTQRQRGHAADRREQALHFDGLQHRLRPVRAFGPRCQTGGREALGQQGDEELHFHVGACGRLSLWLQQQQADVSRLPHGQDAVEDGRLQSRQPDCRRRQADRLRRPGALGLGRDLAEGL